MAMPKKVKPKREPENPRPPRLDGRATRSFLLFTQADPSNIRKNSWFAHLTRGLLIFLRSRLAFGFPGSPRSWLVLSVSDGKFKLRFLNIVIIVYQKFYLFNKVK